MSGWQVDLKASVGTLHLEIRFDVHAAVIVGPNGAGKTTLLRLLAGASTPASGRVLLGGRTLCDRAAAVDLPPESRGVGYVPQGYGLFPHLTALDNVAFGLGTKGARTSRRQRALALLEGLGVEAVAFRRPRQLSGGEQQRVALARALAAEPAGLLLDEPLAALDVSRRRATRAFLVEHLRASGRPSLVVTHDVRDIMALDLPVLVLEGGRIVQSGRIEELARSPASPFVEEVFAI